MNPEDDARQSMNSMYRWTRYIYDLTRKYYLLGRDVLIGRLSAQPGEYCIEIGCGTARNLVRMARLYPQSFFHGIDAADEMLKTARRNLLKHDLQNKVKLAQGLAQSFDPGALFNIAKIDKIIFSYALSIIPPWRESFDHALALLKADGEIHIVDFGAQDRMPVFFRKFLFWWLSKFHVYHKPEIFEHLVALQVQGKGRLKLEKLYRGYAWYAVFTKS